MSMNFKEVVGLLAALATVAVGLVTVMSYMEDDDSPSVVVVSPPSQPQQPAQDLTTARFVFEDDGKLYAIDYNNNIILLGGA